MRTMRRGTVLAAVVAIVLTAGAARAASNPNGSIFRATGWFKGKAQVSEGSVRCEIPTVTAAIPEGAFVLGLWNTYGEPLQYYPDINGGFANPCGVWMGFQNNLLDQAIIVDRVEVSYRIAGAKRFRQYVPTRNGWPIACRPYRRQTLYLGALLNPINSNQDTLAGAPNVAFVEMLPLVNTQVINCLRSQYAPLPVDVFSSFPLVVQATGVGAADVGDIYRTNTIRYTLTMRHTCGNGRVDDGEFCDPLAPTTCLGFCIISAGEPTGLCSHNELIECRSDGDCTGTCLDGNDPSECTCVY